MKALAVGKFLLVVASFAAWSSLATAQNTVGARAQTGTRIGPSSPAPSTPARNSTRSPGQFHAVCLTYRGPTCDVNSRIPSLPDEICHCGPNPGATLSTER